MTARSGGLCALSPPRAFVLLGAGANRELSASAPFVHPENVAEAIDSPPAAISCASPAVGHPCFSPVVTTRFTGSDDQENASAINCLSQSGVVTDSGDGVPASTHRSRAMRLSLPAPRRRSQASASQCNPEPLIQELIRCSDFPQEASSTASRCRGAKTTSSTQNGSGVPCPS